MDHFFPLVINHHNCVWVGGVHLGFSTECNTTSWRGREDHQQKFQSAEGRQNTTRAEFCLPLPFPRLLPPLVFAAHKLWCNRILEHRYWSHPVQQLRWQRCRFPAAGPLLTAPVLPVQPHQRDETALQLHRGEGLSLTEAVVLKRILSTNHPHWYKDKHSCLPGAPFRVFADC